MSKESEQTCLQRIYTKVNKHMKYAQHNQSLGKSKPKPLWDTSLHSQGWLLAIIKKTDLTSIGENVEKSEPAINCYSKCKMVYLFWKIAWQLLKKLKHWVTIQSSIFTSRNIPKRTDNICSQMLKMAFIIIDKKVKSIQMSINWWMGK